MFKMHPAFVDPENDSLKLWRYIDLEKFITIMKNSELIFSRADHYRRYDPFEGTPPKLEYKHSLNSIGSIETLNLYRITSKFTFLSCWHLDEEENLAMWKLYVRNHKGVALQTDIQSFKNSFESTKKPIFAGMIQYINYEKEGYYERSKYNYDRANGFSAYVHKRIIYKYENEYRAICTDNNGEDKSDIEIKITLNKLIHKIYLAPYATDDSFKLVANITKKISKDLIVQRSNFNDKPYLNV